MWAFEFNICYTGYTNYVCETMGIELKIVRIVGLLGWIKVFLYMMYNTIFLSWLLQWYNYKHVWPSSIDNNENQYMYLLHLVVLIFK